MSAKTDASMSQVFAPVSSTPRRTPPEDIAGCIATYAAQERRRKPDVLPTCEFCRALRGAVVDAIDSPQCNACAAEAIAPTPAYPAWLQQQVDTLRIEVQRAGWRSRSKEYRERHPDRRRETVLKYSTSDLKRETAERYRNGTRGSRTRLRWYLKDRLAAARAKYAAGVAEFRADYGDEMIDAELAALDAEVQK
jgi:hypothetical protein